MSRSKSIVWAGATVIPYSNPTVANKRFRNIGSFSHSIYICTSFLLHSSMPPRRSPVTNSHTIDSHSPLPLPYPAPPSLQDGGSPASQSSAVATGNQEPLLQQQQASHCPKTPSACLRNGFAVSSRRTKDQTRAMSHADATCHWNALAEIHPSVTVAA